MSKNQNDQAGEMLIQEVEEDLRREFYIRLWRAYGKYAIVAAVGVVLGVAGYQGYKSWEAGTRAEEASRFSAAVEQMTQGQGAEAATSLEALAKESKTGYVVAARMAEADLKLEMKDGAGAVAAYEALIADNRADALYRDLARVKLAALLLSQNDPKGAEEKLGSLLAPGGVWRVSAMELTAQAALAQKDPSRAVELYRQIAADPEAPMGARQRANEMAASLGGPVEENAAASSGGE